MRREYLENLILRRHINGNRDEGKKRATNLTDLCESTSERMVEVLANAQTLLSAIMTGACGEADRPSLEGSQHTQENMLAYLYVNILLFFNFLLFKKKI